MPRYLVSGGHEIEPAVDGLKSRGRNVSHDGEVDDSARRALKSSRRSGRRFVVVAHGRRNGTVRWYKSERGTAEDWVWMGMPDPPADVRVYLYCCPVGRHLPALLDQCEAFGHTDSVPIPDGVDDALILNFLDQVDRIVRYAQFNPDAWRQRLIRYLEAEYAREIENPSSIVAVPTLRILLRSLDYAGE